MSDSLGVFPRCRVVFKEGDITIDMAGGRMHYYGCVVNQRMVGCPNKQGTLNVHPENENCEMCREEETSAPAPSTWQDWKKICDEQQETISKSLKEIDAWKAEAERLRKYANHLPNCKIPPYGIGNPRFNKDCTCGLTKGREEKQP